MASACMPALTRSGGSAGGRVTASLRRLISKPKLVSPSPSSATSRRFITSSSRLPVELGCCAGSMYPLHSTVAAARMTSRLTSESRSCRALSQGPLKSKVVQLTATGTTFRPEA